jgi:hypothetical protein
MAGSWRKQTAQSEAKVVIVMQVDDGLLRSVCARCSKSEVVMVVPRTPCAQLARYTILIVFRLSILWIDVQFQNR